MTPDAARALAALVLAVGVAAVLILGVWEAVTDGVGAAAGKGLVALIGIVVGWLGAYLRAAGITGGSHRRGGD